MEYQSFGRPQRLKGANIKQALKVMLVLAVCAWLVYQIKHSGNTANYGGQTKLVAGYGAISLGRKGISLQLDERALPNSGNVDSVGKAKESSSGRDDVSDGAKEDKAEEEFEHTNENFRRNEGKVELEPESQPKVSSKDKYKDSSKENSGKVDIESRRNESGHKDIGYEKYPKRPVINDSKSNEKEIEVQLREPPNVVQVRKNAKSDFSVKENDEDEDPRIIEKETRMQKNVVESVTNASVAEEIDEVQSFHDENGVPPDGNETEIVVGPEHFLHEENVSNVSKGSWLGEINFHEVTSGEEINTGTISHVDTSRFKRNSEVGEVNSLVL